MLAEVAQIRRNVRAHDKVSNRYEHAHGEIYNDVEQARLRGTLQRACSLCHTGASLLRAFDLGCGSGNLTRHFIDLGFHVTAADVSTAFLKLVSCRFAQTGRCKTFRLNGIDLREIPTDSFDIAGTYSVLHHIPDYIGAVKELARIVKPGGIVYIDHEVSDAFWSPGAALTQFRRQASETPRPSRRRFRRYFEPGRYAAKASRIVQQVRLWQNPRYQPEGDIHVFPDDHIEWDMIRGALAQSGFDCILDEDYLLYVRGYRREVYERYRAIAADMHMLVARKHNKS